MTRTLPNPLLLSACLLALTLPAASAGPVEEAAPLSARCDFTTGVSVNSSDPLLALAGSAAAPGAVQTEVACEILRAADGSTVLAVEQSLPGSAVAAAGSTPFLLETVVVCTSASAVYADGSVAVLPRTCVTP